MRGRQIDLLSSVGSPPSALVACRLVPVRTRLSVPAGLSAPGLSARELSGLGPSGQGLTGQGLTGQGLTGQGLSVQGRLSPLGASQ
jgi:hypothetical protein